jgi:hypothetical protein
MAALHFDVLDEIRLAFFQKLEAFAQQAYLKHPKPPALPVS